MLAIAEFLSHWLGSVFLPPIDSAWLLLQNVSKAGDKPNSICATVELNL